MKFRPALTLVLSLFLLQPSMADQNDPRLDKLFTNLNRLDVTKENRVQVSVLQSSIWQIWSETNNAEAHDLFEAADEAVQLGKYEVATKLFGQVIQVDDNFSEAWNRRATIYFLTGRMEESLADVEKVIELEPRHFGALAGAGQIYMRLNRLEDARQAFRRALIVNPHMSMVRPVFEQLEKQLDGQGI